eukprot:TRINITY_DN111461_c0_g1_i1.p1 TRINITY_DN111461_c0_g1~~TRINITY_DN111461_c0_g1_i1.p1  ORF type:complete len:247 (+),score=47.83 TRINITY_DN111461_c0_g1_i1:99-839(+)
MEEGSRKCARSAGKDVAGGSEKGGIQDGPGRPVDDDEEMALQAAAEQTPQTKLAQTEAIMEAIIRSSKPLPIDGGGDSGDSCGLWLQRISDKLVPWWWCRWITFLAMSASAVARVFLIERHFFALYVWSIYMLNQLLLFVSPSTEDDHLPMGPTSGEFRPFVRALSEYRLWLRGCLSAAVTIVATFVDDLDFDVDGWALALYFVLLLIYTMQQQISHMIQYRYVPWSSKKSSVGKEKAKKSEAYDV